MRTVWKVQMPLFTTGPKLLALVYDRTSTHVYQFPAGTFTSIARGRVKFFTDADIELLENGETMIAVFGEVANDPGW